MEPGCSDSEPRSVFSGGLCRFEGDPFPYSSGTGALVVSRSVGVARSPTGSALRMCLEQEQFLAPGSHQFPSGEPGFTGAAGPFCGTGSTGWAAADGCGAATGCTRR